jgi:2-(1,2-epoxy-1,2-dihydrophenyl)acetyl-CoA isomerase
VRVAVEIRDAVAELRMVAPQRSNAIDPLWVQELAAAMDRIEAADGARAVLICADGERFSVGGDLDHFAANADRLAEPLAEMVGPFHASLARLGDLPLPVVCAVRGAVAGGALGLLWCADEVLLADDAKLACGFARLGLSGDGGSSWALPRLVGLRRAQEMIMGGRVLSAAEALEWGLATEVVAADAVQERARERAAHYAAGPTVAYGRMRRLMRASAAATWADHLRAETEAMVAGGSTADGREGVVSFVERRDPRFRGA